MDSIPSIIEELDRLNLVNQKTIAGFKKRIDQGVPFTKPQNPESHFCVLFVPYERKSRTIYIVDHIKAGIWSPPGGHIDLNEGPIMAVKREFSEELGFKLTNEKIKLFEANVTSCIPTGICRKHFDLFYVVYMDRQESFKYELREFNSAGWFNLDEAIEKITYPDFNVIMRKFKETFY